MTSIVKTYNTVYSAFDDTKIQKVTLQDFYQPYLPFCENENNLKKDLSHLHVEEKSDIQSGYAQTEKV